MLIVWKIIRIVGLYVISFFFCVIIAAIAFDGLPDALEALFALLAPVAFVWWYEKRRKSKLEFESSAEHEMQPFKSILPGLPGGPAIPPFKPRQTHSSSQPSAPISKATSHRHQGWVPSGQPITIGGRTIDGMIYVGTPPRVGSSYGGESCRAFIDPSLSVAQVGSDKNGDNMPYWPGYSSIPAVCRATYLDWLAGGRQDGTINPGYMFLFFYGLERRFLVDDATDIEKRDILVEARRLKELFKNNHSAQRYLGEFIDLASIMADDAEFKKPIYKSWPTGPRESLRLARSHQSGSHFERVFPLSIAMTAPLGSTTCRSSPLAMLMCRQASTTSTSG